MFGISRKFSGILGEFMFDDSVNEGLIIQGEMREIRTGAFEMISINREF